MVRAGEKYLLDGRRILKTAEFKVVFEGRINSRKVRLTVAGLRNPLSGRYNYFLVLEENGWYLREIRELRQLCNLLKWADEIILKKVSEG